MLAVCSDERLEDLSFIHKRFPGGVTSEAEEDAKLGRQRKPSFRTAQRQDKIAPQKWVQCAKCELWRKVRGCPFKAVSIKVIH